MDDKKQRLIVALKEERKNFFGKGFPTIEHDVAIEYLEKGTTDMSPEKYELLDAAMNDIDCLYTDYLIR